MNRIHVIVFGAIISLTFCVLGCGNSDVKFVKNETMNNYETATIGKVFDASFDDPEWEAFEGKKGERVVQFKGKISKDLHNAAVTALIGMEPDQLNRNNVAGFFASLYPTALMSIGQERVEQISKEKKMKLM